MAEEQSPETLLRRVPRNKRVSPDELKLAVSRSSSVFEAAQRIGVTNGTIYKALRRYNLPNPEQWNRFWMVRVGRLRKLHPRRIVKKSSDRLYVGSLIGTEGTITCSFDSTINSTKLKIQLGMTDRPWVDKFAGVCGVGPPLRLPRNTSARKMYSYPN
ncbi:MAG TPA: hypothetical protein VKF15_00215 [Nitrososphaerales archaeon]|nr:hypothetical protein [Nitrososphaerales archaeon]